MAATARRHVIIGWVVAAAGIAGTIAVGWALW
jgi:hypothetical protein